MDRSAVQASLGKLKLQHRQFGMMIEEMDVAVQTLDDAALVNAIDEIALKYSVPAF